MMVRYIIQHDQVDFILNAQLGKKPLIANFLLFIRTDDNRAIKLFLFFGTLCRPVLWLPLVATACAHKANLFPPH